MLLVPTWRARSGEVAHLMLRDQRRDKRGDTSDLQSLCRYTWSTSDTHDALYGPRCKRCVTEARKVYAAMVEDPPAAVVTTVHIEVLHPAEVASEEVKDFLERQLARRKTWKAGVEIARIDSVPATSDDDVPEAGESDAHPSV